MPIILPPNGPNRQQRRMMDKELDRDLPREERIKKAKERNKEIAVVKMQGFAAKDWEKSVKKYTPKWAAWVAKNIPPRKFILKTVMMLNSCPLAISGGLLRWSIARIQKAKKVPKIIKGLFAVAVVVSSFLVNTVACTLCVVRFPVRWFIIDPIIRFQNFMHKFGVSFRILEDEQNRLAKLVIKRFGKEVETFFYKL